MPRVQRLLAKQDIVDVALHPGTQAGALIPELVAAGVEFSTLTTGDVGRSCGWFQEAVKDGDCASWAAGLERGCGERSDSALW